jgi:hypothetical protein
LAGKYKYVLLRTVKSILLPLTDGNSRIIAGRGGRRGFNTVNPITNTSEGIRVKPKGVKER